MKESTTLLHFFYWILLTLFGLLLGFLLGLSCRKDKLDDRYIFLLLLLFYILSQNEFDDTLWDDLSDSSLASNITESFEKFSLQFIPQIDKRSFKMVLKEPDQIPQFPLLISDDPVIDVDFMIETIEEPRIYQFQLFQFYQDLNEKVKY